MFQKCPICHGTGIDQGSVSGRTERANCRDIRMQMAWQKLKNDGLARILKALEDLKKAALMIEKKRKGNGVEK